MFLPWIVAQMLTPSAAAQDCVLPTTRADLHREVSRIEAAWVAMDTVTLELAENELRHALLCVDEGLSTLDVASFWRARALWYYVNRMPEDAADALRSARAAQPDYVLSSHLVPEYHPLRAMWLAAATPDPDTLPLPADGRRFEVDGGVSTAVPAKRSYVLQVFRDGNVVQTAIIAAGTVPAPVEPTEQEPPCASPTRGVKRLVVAGAVTEAAAAILAGLALSLTDDLRTAPSIPALDATFARQQAFGYPAYALAGGGAVTLAIGAARWKHCASEAPGDE